MYIWLFCAEHTFDRGAFPCAIRTKQSEYRSAFYREIQMLDHGFAGIRFRQPFDKNRFAHSRILLTARSSI